MSGVASLELDKKFERGLVGIFLKVVHHLLPVVFEDVRTPATRLVADSPVGLRADKYASLASVLTPAIDASEERFVLPDGKSSRELAAELIKELLCTDVGECFQSSEHNRPDCPQRLDAGVAGLGIDQLRPVLCDRGTWCTDRWGRRLGRRGRRHRLRGYPLQASQISWFSLHRERGSDFAGVPGA